MMLRGLSILAVILILCGLLFRLLRRGCKVWLILLIDTRLLGCRILTLSGYGLLLSMKLCR